MNGCPYINLGGDPGRMIMIAEAEQAERIWLDYSQTKGYQPSSTDGWRLADIEAGIPWLTEETSEEFIPQMLNLDKLGGLSLTKGCYTGQEVVARTHYLGRSKESWFWPNAKAGKYLPRIRRLLTKNNKSRAMFCRLSRIGTALGCWLFWRITT